MANNCLICTTVVEISKFVYRELFYAAPYTSGKRREVTCIVNHQTSVGLLKDFVTLSVFSGDKQRLPLKVKKCRIGIWFAHVADF